jgi:hypothetical protein
MRNYGRASLAPNMVLRLLNISQNAGTPRYVKELCGIPGVLTSLVVRLEAEARRNRKMVNKEKLLLLATIYMLVPGAIPEVAAENVDAHRAKNKRASAQKIQQARKTPLVKQKKTS